MFKYIRTLNACSGIVETINIPQPAPESIPCEIGTICCVEDGRLSCTKSEHGSKYLVLSAPNRKGEQTCLRIMAGMILDADTYFDATNCKVGEGVSFIMTSNMGIDCVDLGGKECEIIKKKSSSVVTVIVL